MPFWSVVIPMHGRTTHLRQCLNSVLGQVPSMEVIVRDCSGVPDLGKRFGFPRVEWVSAPDLGPVGNNNAAVGLARGEWVHLLHDDDFVMLGFYSALHRGIESSPQVGAASTGYVNVDSNGTPFFKNRVVSNAGICQDWPECICSANPLNPPAVVVRRSVYEEMGGYREDLPYHADWELYARISAKFEWWHDPGWLAAYRRHGDSVTSRDGVKVREAWPKALEAVLGHLPKELRERARERSMRAYAAVLGLEKGVR